MRPLPLMLDNDMADSVRTYLEEKGLNIQTGEKVDKLLGENGKVVGVQLASGKSLDADIVFMNVGVRPNIDLAKDKVSLREELKTTKSEAKRKKIVKRLKCYLQPTIF